MRVLSGAEEQRSMDNTETEQKSWVKPERGSYIMLRDKVIREIYRVYDCRISKIQSVET